MTFSVNFNININKTNSSSASTTKCSVNKPLLNFSSNTNNVYSASDAQNQRTKKVSSANDKIDNLSIYDREFIKRHTKEIKDIAKRTGLSENYIKFLISQENYRKVAKKTSDGRITVGIGHTDNADSNNKIKEGQKITEAQALRFLEQDLKDKINNAKRYFSSFDTLPQSIKDGLVDISFNRGNNAMSSDEIYRSLRANINAGNWAAVTVRMRQEYKPETQTETAAAIMKRNVYRFLVTIKNLSNEDKKKAMDLFTRDGVSKTSKGYNENYLQKTIRLLNKYGYETDAKQLQNDWYNVYNSL